MPKKTKKVEQVIEHDEESATVTLTNNSNEDVVVELRGSVKYDVGSLIAYAPFEVNGETYEAGDVFTPPAGWTRDDSFEEFRSVSHKNSGGQEIGIAFTYAGEIIDKKTKERQARRAVLPLKEA